MHHLLEFAKQMEKHRKQKKPLWAVCFVDNRGTYKIVKRIAGEPHYGGPLQYTTREEAEAMAKDLATGEGG